ncbi:MAG: iron-containing alcohol dehydrogenase [Pedosphaera sp.]|nr:iron-containing alcohol dehydrogenase [Pedosphaera sp.]
MDFHSSGSLAAFDHSPQTRLVFSPGAIVRLGEFARGLGGSRALLVTDQGLVAAGHASRAEESLIKAGITPLRYDRVRENPTTWDVAECVAVARAGRVDLLIGLGGGSSMDTAKGCNFLLTNGGEMRDYWGVGKATRPMLPFIAIPTTAGTGSECQSAALIADDSTHQKMACLDLKAAARIALLDPELTVSQPPRVTALTGVDAISHSLESAVSTRRNSVSTLYSTEAFHLCLHGLEAVLTSPSDVQSRGRMLLGGAFAGLAIENSMLGAAHAAANPLTAQFNVIHGAAVGLMLPSVIQFNSADPAAAAIYARLAVRAGLAGSHMHTAMSVQLLVGAIEALLDKAEVPRSLLAHGIREEAFSELANEASKQWTAGFNPRSVTPADFVSLYRSVA